MSSEAKARAAAIQLQFEEEMRQVELLEQEEKRKKDEARIRAAEISREKAMEEDEVEMVEPTAGPHIEMRKRKRAASGFTILGTLMANGGTWKGEDGWVCNPCHQLNRSCVGRQDNKKVRTCY